MQSRLLRNLAKTALVIVLANTLTACAPSGSPDSVSEAYVSAGSVAVQPYTRSIFSSNNF